MTGVRVYVWIHRWFEPCTDPGWGSSALLPSTAGIGMNPAEDRRLAFTG